MCQQLSTHFNLVPALLLLSCCTWSLVWRPGQQAAWFLQPGLQLIAILAVNYSASPSPATGEGSGLYLLPGSCQTPGSASASFSLRHEVAAVCLC